MRPDARDDQAGRRRSRVRGLVGQLVGWSISIACIAYVATKVDFASVKEALAHLDGWWIAVGLCSLAVGYSLRIARWAMMLRAAGADVGTSACAAPFLGSIALNNVLPLRAGDVVRALVFPARLGVSRTTSAASLLLERIMDLLSLILCLGIGLALLGTTVELPPHLRSLISLLAIATAIALGLLMFASPRIALLLERFAERRPVGSALHRVLHIAASLLARIAAMSRPTVLATLGGMSLLVWVFEAGLYYALMRGLQIPTGAAAALTVAATTTLSTLVPSTPGYVGPFHLAAFAAVTMLGSDAAQAGAFAVLAHITLWGATTLAGAVAIMVRRDLFTKASRNVNPRAAREDALVWESNTSTIQIDP